MDKIFAGLFAFTALAALFDLLLRGNKTTPSGTKPPRDLAFAEVILLLAVVLGICSIWSLLPYPIVMTMASAALTGFGIALRKKLTGPKTQQSVVVPAPTK